MPEIKQFDHTRSDFAPYGFTVERWGPVKASRTDSHAEIELNYLVSGELTYMYGSKRFKVPSRQLTLFWAAVPHQVIEFNNVDHYYVVTIPLRLAIDWRLPTDLLKPLINGQVLMDSPSFNEAESRRFETWCMDFESNDPVRREILLLELHARMLRLSINANKSSQPSSGSFRSSTDSEDYLALDVKQERIGSRFRKDSAKDRPQVETSGVSESHRKAETMAQYIAQNFSRKLPIDEIASHAGLHADYAASLFRKSFGMTMVDLITSYRIINAQRLLITTSLPISEIAKASGFETLSRFNSAFKQHSNSTPRDYRRQTGHHPRLADS